MFNAYSGSNSVPLPGRDVRFSNIIVDGDVKSESSTESLTVIYEDSVTAPVSVDFKKVGDLVYMYLPQLSHTGAVYTSPFREFINIPEVYRPISGEINGESAQSIPSVSNINTVKYAGYCYITNGGILRYYTKVDHSLPTNNVPVENLSQVICWSVNI